MQLSERDNRKRGQMSNWQSTTCWNRPGAKQSKCCVCGKPFIMDTGGWKQTRIMVREEKTSWFRGDDSVEFAHTYCFNKGEI